jgi:hypothetical protein
VVLALVLRRALFPQPPPFHGVMKASAPEGTAPPSPPELRLTAQNRKSRILLGNHPQADIRLADLPKDKLWTIQSAREKQKRVGRVICPTDSGVVTKVDGIQTTAGRTFDARGKAEIQIGDYRIDYSQFG